MLKEEKIEWILGKHSNTNHMYDKYLPYEFHLRIVVEIHKKFKSLLPSNFDHESIELACFGHDLIEDTRTSYNDVKKVLGKKVADIIYAVTNDKGKNRKERAGSNYYAGIVNEPGATYVKLCDRIGNVQYGIMTGSDMLKMYRKELHIFLHKLELDKDVAIYLSPMVDYLIELLLPKKQ